MAEWGPGSGREQTGVELFGVEGAVSWGWLPGKPSGREA